MTTTFYLIRHGEVHNPEGIFYSRLPGFGLSERGRNEAAQSGIFLKNKHIDYIYSSPLLRAKQTAEIIRKNLGLSKVLYSKSLLEVRSTLQGRKFTELGFEQRDVYFSHERTHADESFEQIAMRMLKVIDKLSLQLSGKKIVVVSHGDPLMLLRGVLNGLPAEYNTVRAGNGFKYIQHAEVLELKVDENGKKTITSVFVPRRTL